MTCAACQAHVDRAVSRLDGAREVAVNLLAGTMAVDYDENLLDADQICAAVDRAGYSATPQVPADAKAPGAAEGRSPESPTKKLEQSARAMRVPCLAVSLAFLVPLFYVGMGDMLGLPCPTPSETTTTP